MYISFQKLSYFILCYINATVLPAVANKSTDIIVHLNSTYTRQVTFIMDKNTTLSDLLALNLHECEEEVKNIVDKAVKEMSMEKILRDLHSVWNGSPNTKMMEFEYETHLRTGSTLLKASEELIETLEENQVMISFICCFQTFGY